MKSSRRRGSWRACKPLHRSTRSTRASPKAEDSSKPPPPPQPTSRAETTPHTWASAAEGRSQSQIQPKVTSEWSDADADRRLTFASALAHHVKTKAEQPVGQLSKLGRTGQDPANLFPAKPSTLARKHIEGGDPMGWNRVWWWLEWISPVGQGDGGERGPGREWA